MNIYFTVMNSSRGENPDVALQTMTPMTEVTIGGVIDWLMAIDESADFKDITAQVAEMLMGENELAVYDERGIHYLPGEEHCWYFKKGPFTFEDIQFLVEEDWGMEWEGAFDNLGNEILPDENGGFPILDWEG